MDVVYKAVEYRQRKELLAMVAGVKRLQQNQVSLAQFVFKPVIYEKRYVRCLGKERGNVSYRPSSLAVSARGSMPIEKTMQRKNVSPRHESEVKQCILSL